MKIKDIISTTQVQNLNEGIVPPHITMALQRVIDEKAITNVADLTFLAGMLGMVRDGTVKAWPRDMNGFVYYMDIETTELLKSLPADELVAVAQWVYNKVTEMEDKERQGFFVMCGTMKNYVEQNILAAQD